MPAERTGDAAQTRLDSGMEPFSTAFTATTWPHVLVLIAGTILSPGRRTAAALLDFLPAVKPLVAGLRRAAISDAKCIFTVRRA